MSNTIALGGPDQQQTGYMQTGYQTNMTPDMPKGQPTPVGGMPQGSNGLDKGDGSKDSQQGHMGWQNSMEQAYFKSGTPGHPGNYYGQHMAPPHHPYMWGAQQQMMPPYGSAPHSHYGYGAMYAQHPAMNAAHPSAAYGYTSPSQGQGKDGMMVSPAGPQGMQNQSSVVPGSSVQDHGNTDVSSEEELQRNKRGYESMNPAEAGVQMATPAGATAAPQYPYSSDMWAMGAPVQRAQGSQGMPGEVAPLPYQDEREIKRQRRKQSNRESARRSRLRKQAECEDLSIRVNSLSAENNHLKKQLLELQSRVSSLTEENGRLRNQALAVGVSVEGNPAPAGVVVNFQEPKKPHQQTELNETVTGNEDSVRESSSEEKIEEPKNLHDGQLIQASQAEAEEVKNEV